MKEKSALIAMSGGVDSSCAAFLMREQGYECMGTTMRLYRNEDLGACNFRTCCSEKDIEDASEVAFQLDIPYEVLDFTADFQDKIIEKFIRTYEEGGTPNPCIDCNRFMKFDKLLDFAFAHGLNYIVTGHYARIERDENTGRYLLKKGVDEGKDQSYVLYNLTQHQLAHTIFPLGAYSKTQIREMAEQQSFCNARKHDSQDICFVPDGDYVGFMEQYTGKRYPSGDFIDESGKKDRYARRRGALHHRSAPRSGSADGRPRLRLREGHGKEYRDRRAGGVAVREARHRPRHELDFCSRADGRNARQGKAALPAEGAAGRGLAAGRRPHPADVR